MDKQDVLKEINDCTAACVEDQRNTGLNWLKPRRAFEPGCTQDCNQKYAADLSAVQQQDSQIQAATQNALLNQLKNGNAEMFKIIGVVFFFLLIIAVIIG